MAGSFSEMVPMVPATLVGRRSAFPTSRLKKGMKHGWMRPIQPMTKPKAITHLAWLKDTGEVISTTDGKKVSVWELACDANDSQTWKAWAKHFREHYCLDAMIDLLKEGTPYAASRADYLKSLVFPDENAAPGPSIRAGDFAEILVADLIEDHFGIWVPRTRYKAKAIRNESTKGTDIIGIQVVNGDGSSSPKDKLFTLESKAQFSGLKAKPRLQHAVDDSMKDEIRKAETLNAVKRRLLEEGRIDDAKIVQRFQDAFKAPYVEQTCAAALFCNSVYDASEVAGTSCAGHNNADQLILIVIRSNTFMKLVHQMYERAANEA